MKNWKKELWSKFKSVLGNSSIDNKNNSMYDLEAFIKKVEKQAFIDGVKAQTKTLNKHYAKVIKEEKEKIIKEIEGIDFYGWNKETQIMIKNKIKDL